MGIIGAMLLILVVVFFSNILRFGRVGYLILIITPYRRAIKGARRILVVGDSTAYGTGAKRSEETIAGRIGGSSSPGKSPAGHLLDPHPSPIHEYDEIVDMRYFSYNIVGLDPAQ